MRRSCRSPEFAKPALASLLKELTRVRIGVIIHKNVPPISKDGSASGNVPRKIFFFGPRPNRECPSGPRRRAERLRTAGTRHSPCKPLIAKAELIRGPSFGLGKVPPEIVAFCSAAIAHLEPRVRKRSWNSRMRTPGLRWRNACGVSQRYAARCGPIANGYWNGLRQFAAASDTQPLWPQKLTATLSPARGRRSITADGERKLTDNRPPLGAAKFRGGKQGRLTLRCTALGRLRQRRRYGLYSKSIWNGIGASTSARLIWAMLPTIVHIFVPVLVTSSSSPPPNLP